ncbi:LPP20 lipoprotein [Formivibrio citricus]|uniref:LPP20 lipoprotein n=1 Tax=Formivibrio citricus TaxID=83765 RepID=A0A1I5DPK8_9NEIS|nr:LPP20 family lipoprotein [Formivibrio citricus]SFO01189.1 LPP20 lipoprotein [Formivibrio citricus]
MANLPLRSLSLIVLSLFTLAGCSSMRSTPSSNVPATVHTTAPVQESAMPPVILPSKVTATGYGTLPTQEGLSMEQRRLLAMRASKLDAYRSLAETVSGLKITGNSTVSAVTMNNDSFRVYVEAYLRGARVLTVTPMPGGSYETVLELQLGGEFYRDAGVAAHGQPVMPPIVAAPAAAPAQPVTQPAAKPAAAAPADTSATSSNFYLAQ